MFGGKSRGSQCPAQCVRCFIQCVKTGGTCQCHLRCCKCIPLLDMYAATVGDVLFVLCENRMRVAWGCVKTCMLDCSTLSRGRRSRQLSKSRTSIEQRDETTSRSEIGARKLPSRANRAREMLPHTLRVLHRFLLLFFLHSGVWQSMCCCSSSPYPLSIMITLLSSPRLTPSHSCY